MKTRAAVLNEINQPLYILDLNIPMLEPGQVLVSVAFSGICRTQLNEIKGLKGEDRYLPHTLGHEGSGIVLEIGNKVSKVRPGDHVVLTWIKGNGADVPSTVYTSTHGPINSGPISTFMEKTVVSENRLVPIPKNMPLKEAALLGCAIPTGAGIVLNSINIKQGYTLAVFGVGGVGLSAIMAAHACGAEKIIAIDLTEDKLRLAQQVGATHLVNVSQGDALTNIIGITNGVGVDYALEAAGQVETMEAAFKSVRDSNGKCVIAGNLPKGKKISIDPMELIKGKQIVGSWGGETKPDVDILKYVGWYLENKLNLSNIITHIYKLEEINKAFDGLEKGKIGRALVDMQPQ